MDILAGRLRESQPTPPGTSLIRLINAAVWVDEMDIDFRRGAII